MENERIAEGWGVVIELLEQKELLKRISHGAHVWTAELAGAESGTGVWDCFTLIRYTNPDEAKWPTERVYGFPTRHEEMFGRVLSTPVNLHPLLMEPFQGGRYLYGSDWSSDFARDAEHIWPPIRQALSHEMRKVRVDSSASAGALSKEDDDCVR